MISCKINSIWYWTIFFGKLFPKEFAYHVFRMLSPKHTRPPQHATSDIIHENSNFRTSANTSCLCFCRETNCLSNLILLLSLSRCTLAHTHASKTYHHSIAWVNFCYLSMRCLCVPFGALSIFLWYAKLSINNCSRVEICLLRIVNMFATKNEGVFVFVRLILQPLTVYIFHTSPHLNSYQIPKPASVCLYWSVGVMEYLRAFVVVSSNEAKINSPERWLGDSPPHHSHTLLDELNMCVCVWWWLSDND